MTATVLALFGAQLAVQAAPATLNVTVSVPKLAPRQVRIQNIKPGFINNLAAARMVAITNGQGAHARSGPMRKMLATMTGPKKTQIATTADAISEAEEFGILPVAYIVPTAPRMVTVNYDDADVRYVHEPQISRNQATSALDVSTGEFILNAKRDMQLDLPGATVRLKEGTVVKVACSEEGGRIINALDKKRDAVVIHVCKKTFTLAPGQECRFSLSSDFVKQVPHDGCGRRADKDNSCCTWSIRTSEVGVAALLKHDAIGRQIYLSNEPSDVKVKNGMLRMAASLANWYKVKSPFSWN